MSPVKCKRNRLLLCYGLVFVCLKPQRRWKWEKKSGLHLSLKSKLDIYVSAFTLPSPEIVWKTLEFFLNIKQRVIFFPITFLTIHQRWKKKKFCFFKKKAILLRWRSQVCERFQIFSYFQVNRSDVFTKSNRLLMQRCKVYNKTVKI